MRTVVQKAGFFGVLFSFLTLMVAVSLVVSPKAYAAQTPGVNGRIMYIHEDHADNNIYSFKTDGSDVKQLTDNGPTYSPIYSPDGTKMAYLSNTAPTILYIANADGSNRVTLDTPFYSQISWSPDGKKLLATAQNGTSYFNIYTVNIDGTGLTQLTNYGYSVSSPQFSPDGTKIAYSNNTDIFVMNANGSSPVNVTNGASAQSRYPIWAPNGSKIMYRTFDSGVYAVSFMNPDGSGKTSVTTSPIMLGDSAYPVYSPDGTKVAYIDGITQDIHIMNVDGSGDTAIPGDPAAAQIAWQPLTLGPTAPSTAPSVTVSGGKATVDVPSLFIDPYGVGVNKSSVSVTVAPTHGSTTVDSTTGVVTYKVSGVAASGQPSFLARLSSFVFPKASAATASDQFTVRACSTSSSSLCTTSVVSVFGGAPDTGYGTPASNLPTFLIGALSIISIAVGLQLLRSKQKSTS